MPSLWPGSSGIVTLNSHAPTLGSSARRQPHRKALRMKRVGILLSAIAACSLLVAGCSASDSGSPTGSSAATSSAESSTESSAEGSGASSSAAGSGETENPADAGTTTNTSAVAPDSEGAAAELDAPTVAWFDTFCAGLAPLATLDLSDQVNTGPTDAPDPADPDNAIQKETLVSSLTAAGAAFVQTSQALAAQAPPTFDGGAEFATAAADGLGTAGGQISAAVSTFDAVPAGATDEYWTAKSALRTQALAALAPLQTLSEPPAGVQEGVTQIPSCQALGL
jgi:hypothetical protein